MATHERSEGDRAGRPAQAEAHSGVARPPASHLGLGAARLLALQRAAGNRAVTRALRRKPLYRGMQAETPNGTRPLLGNDSGFQLGVRDAEFGVDGDGTVVPGSGGMSTANARAKVPDFTVSRAYPFGSHRTNDPGQQAFRWVWEFDDAHLPAGLQARNDHGAHVVIEAAEPMKPEELRRRVQGTQDDWARSDPP